MGRFFIYWTLIVISECNLIIVKKIKWPSYSFAESEVSKGQKFLASSRLKAVLMPRIQAKEQESQIPRAALREVEHETAGRVFVGKAQIRLVAEVGVVAGHEGERVDGALQFQCGHIQAQGI